MLKSRCPALTWILVIVITIILVIVSFEVDSKSTVQRFNAGQSDYVYRVVLAKNLGSFCEDKQN